MTDYTPINKVLNILLASEYVLSVQTEAAHWNLEDPSFAPFHGLFGDQYDQIAGIIDEVAERVRQLQGVALGTMKDFLEKSIIKETTTHIGAAKEFIQTLLNMHTSIIDNYRLVIENIEETDCVTANLLQDWIARHEKMAWFLRSHLK